MKPGDKLRFKYSGLLQSAEVTFKKSESPGSFISCVAQVSIPILKKTAKFITEYADEGDHLQDWSSTEFSLDEGEAMSHVDNNEEYRSQNVMDLVTFFMTLHEGEWNSSEAKVLVSKHVVSLKVIKTSNGYEVRRPDRDQKLFITKDVKGIFSIDIPVPVLGTLSLKRLKN